MTRTQAPPWAMTLKGMIRRWKTCLPLLLTGLLVAVLTLLPPRLSEWEDVRRAAAVQCEALPPDSNFPAAPPDLPGRIRLLARWQQSPEEIATMQQLLEEPEAREEAAAMMRAELAALTEAGVLPSGQPEFGLNFSASRLYLRDPADLSSAGFLRIQSSDREGYDLLMILDRETGLALSFRITGPAVILEGPSPEEIGARFLNYLQNGTEDSAGMSWEIIPREKTPSVNHNVRLYLPSIRCYYSAIVMSRLMRFMPVVLEEAGTPVSDSGKSQSAG